MEELKEQGVKGENYAALHVGDWTGLLEKGHQTETGKLGKLFLKELLGLTGMEVSIGVMPAGSQIPFSHSHIENEELYLFIKGAGQFYIDGEVLDVREGTVIRVTPAGVRAWRNNSSEDLHYLCIQAKEGSLQQYTATDGKIIDRPFTWPEK